MDPNGGGALKGACFSRLCARRRVAATLFAVAHVVVFLLPAMGEDERALQCGVPYVGSLDRGERQEFRIGGVGGAVVVVDAVDVSGTIDLLKIETHGRNRTCSGSMLTLPKPGDDAVEIEVSDCIGRDQGRYVITASVVSQGPANCARPLDCGRMPGVQRFTQPGQTRSYSFLGRAGDTVQIWAGKGLPRDGVQRMRLRLFDPRGIPLPGASADSCGGRLTARLPVDGVYTLLVSLCGKAEASLYWLAFDSPTCPSGPEVSFMGVARPDGQPLAPAEYDAQGRPVYRPGSSSGFVLVFEGAPGRSGKAVGDWGFRPEGAGEFGWPDLQVLFSRPLGNGSPGVCDTTGPRAGGIPAVPSLEFDETPRVRNAVNDFGCRVDDGTRQPRGVPKEYACTYFPDGEFRFVRSVSTLQFCALVTRSWFFPPGQTVVRARLRDELGNVGPAREMVIEVPGSPSPACAGDCDADGMATVDEVVTTVRMALGDSPITACLAADRNGDGEVTIDEVLVAVASLLEGCG